MRILLFLFLLVWVPKLEAQILFQENASSLGAAATYGISNLGGGVSFHDFDGDGWDDITLATGKEMETLFFKNIRGYFEQVDLGINDTFETKQVLWVDYDNDGDKDFFATSITGLNKLYENNGNMTFKDVTTGSGLFLENLYTYGAAFGDIDNDGDLDVFLTHRDVISKNQRNYLYLYDDGVYSDITEAAGLNLENDLSFCASFFDYNNDGFQDIYVSNDKYLKSNKLYRNRGDGTFEDVSDFSGAGMAIDAMSTTIDDYNNDGWLDIYVTNTTLGNYHLRNNGDGTFTNVAEELGTDFKSIAWGAVYLDADNDTDLDLYVSGMLDGSDPTRLPSAFYENKEGLFSIPSGIGFAQDRRTSFSNAIGDVDNDGLPDILVMNDSEDNFLWHNQGISENNWIKVRLKGTLSNRSGIGSKIEIGIDGDKQYRYTLCGEGYLGQNSSFEFFGLGNATSVDYIRVSWLSGEEDYIENVSANRNYEIEEGSGEAIDLELEEESFPPDEEPGDEEESNSSENLDNADAADTAFNESENCISNKGKFFPNPAISGLSMACADFNGGRIKIEIFSMQGRKVDLQYISDSDPNVDLTTLGSGIYLLKISEGKKVYFEKIVRL